MFTPDPPFELPTFTLGNWNRKTGVRNSRDRERRWGKFKRAQHTQMIRKEIRRDERKKRERRKGKGKRWREGEKEKRRAFRPLSVFFAFFAWRKNKIKDPFVNSATLHVALYCSQMDGKSIFYLHNIIQWSGFLCLCLSNLTKSCK
jgi:hypothetical protein